MIQLFIFPSDNLTLNLELERLYSYFYGNSLIINLKKGKTEVMMFGTSKRLSMTPRNVKLTCNGIEINNTNSYTYLGSIIDPTLSLADNFDRSLSKANGRIKLLQKIRCYLTAESSMQVYKMMILPLLTYLLQQVHNRKS